MFIYGLKDPRTDEIRYIGKTNDCAIRLHYHRTHCKTGRTHKDNWLVGLKTAGYEPDMVILEETETDAQAYEREQHWIAYGREQGWKLTNHTDGGEGTLGYQWTDEQRTAFSQKKKGTTFTDEHRAALSFAQKERLEREPHVRQGMRHSPESVEKMRQAHTGKPLNADHAKRSADRAAEWADPEIRARRIAGLKAYYERRKVEQNGNE